MSLKIKPAFLLLTLFVSHVAMAGEKLDQAIQFVNSEQYVQALPLLEELSQEGDAEAQFLLGDLYRSGRGVAKDQLQALKLYHQSAEQNHNIAQFYIGVAYDLGDGVEKDLEQAFSWYEKAAKNGNSQAQYNIAEMYARGEGVETDIRMMMYWFEQSAQANNIEAMHAMGIVYSNPSYDRVNLDKSKQYYQEAADLNFEPSIINLGIIYENEGDHKKAFNLYLQAAQSGSADGQFYVGDLYRMGKGVTQDREIAKQYYQLAATQGHQDAIGMLQFYEMSEAITITGVSTENSYGYTADNPINVGNGPSGERTYLQKLRGPNGEPVEYQRLGSCCGFESPNSPFGTGLLDQYEVRYEGQDKPALLYLNMYEQSILHAPQGFTFENW